jgi:spore coat polysaccharide biosynthesis protein SpsF
MKTVAIIQARMGSTRLPGKALMPIGNATMLARVVERTRRAQRLDSVVVATTLNPADDAIVDECQAINVAVCRGDENDVLDRYYRTAVAHNCDAVVRITSDCPLIDPGLIDKHVDRLMHRWREVDFVTNMMRQTFPLGLAVEAMPIDVLERMDRMSTTAFLREHVTTLAYEQPELFSIEHVLHDVNLSGMRWTVDTPGDIEFVRRVFECFENDRFTWGDILTTLDRHPELSTANRSVNQR